VTMDFPWQDKYTEAMLELDREKLPQRIEAAEKAIYQRIEEFKRNPASSAEELFRLNDALRGLRVLAKSECSGQRAPDSGISQSGVSS
jgi:hypothetical protein